MKARRKVPTFRTDRDAADYWAKHDSASYAKDLPAVAVKALPALRRRVAARAKKPVTLRLEEGQIAAWIRWYNEARPHQALGYGSPREHRAQQGQRVA
jgi:transposase InsO family protein